MASHDSIRPEASTVHRMGDGESREPADSSPVVDEQHLVQAKTVIRGSSRAGSADEGSNLSHRDTVHRTPASVAQVLLGQHLNHFFLEEFIGGGGMGAVFRARDEKLDRVVAIKVIPFVGDDPDLQRRFRNEAQSAAKLDHPRIAKVFEVGSHGEWHYIVFEYIRGTNVRDLVLKGGVLSIDDAVFYTCQLAAAIQHAADRGIVHRDIKPSNILIGDEDTIKLVDMGLARSENFELSEDMTASGVTLGTFDYISPEQARDPRDADLRSDIYSLGCTLYFMLTGYPPYPGGTMLQKLLSHGNSPPPDARELRPEVSDELMAIIRKMLAKIPADRYQSATDLIADLREVAYRDDLTRTQAVGPVPMRESHWSVLWLQRHAAWVSAIVLLMLVAVIMQLAGGDTSDQWNIPQAAKPPLQTLPAESLSDPDSTRPQQVSGSGEEASANGSVDPPAPVGVAAEMLGSEDRVEPALPPPGESIARITGVDPASPPAGELAGSQQTADERTAGPESASVFEVPLTVRVVGAGDAGAGVLSESPADRVVLTESLSEALQLAERYEIEDIELGVSVVASDPLVINRDNLRIHSTVAGGSTIVFEPNESLTMERINLIALGSNRIEIDDVHFVWRVPGGEINGGALFAINDNPLIRLTDCTITVENPADCQSVYAFDVVTDPEQISARSGGRASQDDEALPLVAIELNNVIVRGGMGMVHMDYAAELQLNWDNGLLAISEAMVDTAGARVRPAPTARPIQLQLTRLTAHCPKGLFRMRVGVSGAYPVPVDRFAHSCVFVVDIGTPHFEFRGVEASTDSPSLLQLSGTTNAYDTDPTLAEPVLVVWTGSDDFETTRFNRLTSRWPDEVSPRWSVYWSEVRLSDAPMSRRRPADYRQNGSVRSGFDEKLLPILPDFSGSPAGISGRFAPQVDDSGEREL